MRNILVCGLYFSGSSAVTDLLSEYEGITSIPGEFDDIRRAGMLGDHVQGKISANNPCTVEAACNGFWYPTRYNPTYRYYVKQLLRKVITSTPLSYIYKRGAYKELKSRSNLLRETVFSLRKEPDFEFRLQALKKYINSVTALYSKDKDNYALFDQPIFLNTHQNIWPKIFDPYKLIIVYREPRDQIAQLIKLGLIFFDIETPTRGLINIYGDDRLGAVRYELDTLQARFNNAKKLQETFGKDKVKLVSFDALVSDYEKEKADIELFLGLNPALHIKEKEVFKPGISSRNIGIYKDYLTEEELMLFEKVELNLND